MRVNKLSKLSKLTQKSPIRIVVSQVNKLTILVVSLFTNYYRDKVNYKLSRFYV